MSQTYRRKKKVILPRLQLRLIGLFTGLAALGILLEFLLIGARVSAAIDIAHETGQSLSDVLPGVLLTSLAATMLVILPLMLLIGIQVTHRIAGPIYRFEQYLGSIARGEDPGVCRIRERDEFDFLCQRINEAVTHLRGEETHEDSPASEADELAGIESPLPADAESATSDPVS